MTPAARLELAGALKRRVEDVNIRVPKSTAIRHDLHAVRRAAGPTGAPRLVATEDTDGHADRCAGLRRGRDRAGGLRLHRIDKHADLRVRPNLGRPGTVRWRELPGALYPPRPATIRASDHARRRSRCGCDRSGSAAPGARGRRGTERADAADGRPRRRT